MRQSRLVMRAKPRRLARQGHLYRAYPRKALRRSFRVGELSPQFIWLRMGRTVGQHGTEVSEPLSCFIWDDMGQVRQGPETRGVPLPHWYHPRDGN